MRRIFVSIGLAGLALAATLVVAGAAAAQDQPPLLVVLDHSAIDYGPDPHAIPSQAANVDIADVGLRDQLPYFASRVDASATLPGGADSAGWFVVGAAPASWASDVGLADGLDNFFVAGPGLGSPDAAGSRTTRLTAVTDVAALSASDLYALVGRRVCAVAYAGEITPGATTDLSGATLGTAAFAVTSVTDTGTGWPSLTVTVLDVREVCAGALVTTSVAGSQ
jgi:hypothetical protein